MALVNTFYERAIRLVMGNKPMTDAVDGITKQAPIVANMPTEEASDNFTDSFEILEEVDGISNLELDAPIPEINLSTDVKTISLMSFGGKIRAGLDKLRLLGKSMAEYVKDRLPLHYKKTMEKLEVTWIYNFAIPFVLKNYAEGDASRLIDGEGANDTNYSIVAVRWEPGETSMLYDKDGYGDKGAVFEAQAEWNGGVGEDKDGRSVQGVIVKSYLGFKFANPLHVTAMVNIDVATIPTEKQLGDLIDNADGADALYMHPTLARAISKAYGTDKISYKSGDTNMSQLFRQYDDTPIISSRNFKAGTEANVTVPVLP